MLCPDKSSIHAKPSASHSLWRLSLHFLHFVNSSAPDQCLDSHERKATHRNKQSDRWYFCSNAIVFLNLVFVAICNEGYRSWYELNGMQLLLLCCESFVFFVNWSFEGIFVSNCEPCESETFAIDVVKSEKPRFLNDSIQWFLVDFQDEARWSV